MKLLLPRVLVASVLGLLVASLGGCDNRTQKVTPPVPDIHLETPSELTQWPWPKAKSTSPHRGVTHWLATQKDGTTVELVRFDFKANPQLKFELYTQDEDDAKPLDNTVKFWPMGVGQATRHLNQRLQKTGEGVVVAAWNGPFFGYYRSAPIPDETAFHLAPVVLRGKVLFNTSNHRWTFGVKYEDGKPVFKTFHLPGRALLQREFDYAAGTIQCLIKDGQPLKLEPFPRGPEDFRKQPVASTPQEVGHIPHFDHSKFSRASIGWSRDNQQLYLLLVREPNGYSEGQSIGDLSQWKPQSQGWNVPDLQRFWLSMMKNGHVWNAINSDAGDVAQLAYRLPDGKYELVSPIGDNPKFARRVFTPDFKDAPQGGGLMYFYVRDAKAR